MNSSSKNQKRKRREKLVKKKLEARRQRIRLLRVKMLVEQEKQDALVREAEDLLRMVPPETIILTPQR